MATTGTVFHTLTDAAKRPLAGQRVTCRLYAGTVQQAWDTTAQAELLQETQTLTDHTGRYQFALTPNPDLQPSGTVYQVEHANGEQLTFTLPDTSSHWLMDLLTTAPQASPLPVTPAATAVAYAMLLGG